MEQKTVYRYRDKSYTYNGAGTLSGYTKESTEYYNFGNSSWQSGSYAKYSGWSAIKDKYSASDQTSASYREQVTVES